MTYLVYTQFTQHTQLAVHKAILVNSVSEGCLLRNLQRALKIYSREGAAYHTIWHPSQTRGCATLQKKTMPRAACGGAVPGLPSITALVSLK